MHHTVSQDSRSGEPMTAQASAATVGREPVPPAVAVEHLTKRYDPTAAVDDLSFAIRRGTVSGLLGPNGAGKTTTFRMLVGLADPTSGVARVLGQPYMSLKGPDPAGRSVAGDPGLALFVGYVFVLTSIGLQVTRRRHIS